MIRGLREWMSWPTGVAALLAWFGASALLMLPLEALGVWILRLRVARDDAGRLTVVAAGRKAGE